MSDATTHLLLPYILAAQAQKHVTHNEALRLLDGLVQLSVLDRDLTAPPGSPADGDRFIVASAATGDWAGWDLNVALWTDGAWLRLPPRTGWRAWVEDEGLLLVYDGAGWIGTTPDVLQNMALLGVGTTADASNPFSAKLNAALWTAKTVAEGGTGDLFYTMNKEAAGDDLGLTLQTGFVTKALVGLFGSDRFRLAVSADGSTFFDGLSVDNATGIVDQPRLPRFKAYTNYDNYVGVGTWTKIGLNNTDYNDHAIWAFAPGAEIPKDKRLYTACGFVFRRDGHQGVVNEAAPLGASLPYWRCTEKACGTIAQGNAETCHVCGNPAQTFPLYQPKGFMAHWKARDYDGQRQRGPALPPPVRAFDQPYDPSTSCGPMLLALGQGQVALINDNGGDLYEFTQEPYDKVTVRDGSL